MNVVACDRCGRVITKTTDHQTRGWIDGAGVCPTCGNELCPDCAHWDGNDECEHCRVERGVITTTVCELRDALQIAFQNGFRMNHLGEDSEYALSKDYARRIIDRFFRKRT